MSREVEAFLPHRGPALLIEDILEDEGGLSVCRARVPADSPFRTSEGGRAVVPTYLALEMGAQAAATIEGRQRAHHGARGAPAAGLVVGVREAVFHAPHLPAEGSFLVRTAQLESAPPLRVYRVEVRLEESGSFQFNLT